MFKKTSLVIGKNNDFHVANHHHVIGGDNELWYYKGSNGDGSWSDGVLIDSDLYWGVDDANFQIALDPITGWPQIAYIKKVGNYGELWFAEYNGSSWITEPVHEPPTPYSVRSLDFVTDSSGNAHIVVSVNNDELWYWTNSPGFWFPIKLHDGSWVTYSSITVNSLNLPMVAYVDSSDDSIYFATCEYGFWQAESKPVFHLSGNSIKYLSMDLDPFTNQPVIAFYINQDKTLYIACRQGWEDWEVKPADGTEPGEYAGKYCDVAVDKIDGNIHLSYHFATYVNKLRHMICPDCQ